jgi:hypothetical protein
MGKYVVCSGGLVSYNLNIEQYITGRSLPSTINQEAVYGATRPTIAIYDYVYICFFADEKLMKVDKA